jgi:hypothetical protein
LILKFARARYQNLANFRIRTLDATAMELASLPSQSYVTDTIEIEYR